MTEDTIADLLLNRVGDERTGLKSHERSWTWDEVVRESSARAELARSLRAEGPFHIGVLLENVPEFLFWLGGAALAGASIVGINPTRGGTYLEQEVAHTDCQLIVTDRAGMQLLDGLDIGVPADRFLLVDTDEYRQQVDGKRGEPFRDPAIDASTRMLLLFTSGTTGASKAALCSQGRLVELGRNNSAKYGVTGDDVCYCPMPLFHGNAIMALWAPALFRGACVALTPKFSASRFLPDVRLFGATYFTYVGKALGYVLAQPEAPDDADNPLVHGFGTEASPEDRQTFLRRFGCELAEGYGSSEGAGMLKAGPGGRPESLGLAAKPGVCVVDPDSLRTCPPAVLDDTGRIANAEEAVGQIIDKDGAARFEGYYNNPAANAERVRNGWYWTGDLGYVDADGYFYFAGRSGDWIRVDGENISALTTERVLCRHDGIIAAAAFGVPDPRSGDQVMAAVEIREDIGFDDLDLPNFLRGQDDLGAKGAPRFVRVSHGLPTTGSGKLSKKELQTQGWRTADAVYHWPGRGEPEYRLLTADDEERLREEFAAAGRLQFLP